MALAIGKTTDRENHRFTIDKGGDLKIIVRRNTDDGQEKRFEATPLDVSYGGLKLHSPQPLVFGDLIDLQFLSAELDIDFSVEAEVRWMREWDDECWIVGCLFQSQLTRECVDELAMAGDIDRREEPRVDAEMKAQLQLAGDPDPFPVTLLDYSSQGLRFASSEAVVANRPIKVLLDDGMGNSYEVRATSRWSRTYESGHLVGCLVNGGKNCSQFQAWRAGFSTSCRRSSRTRLLSVYGCFIIALMLVWIWTLIW